MASTKLTTSQINTITANGHLINPTTVAIDATNGNGVPYANQQSIRIVNADSSNQLTITINAQTDGKGFDGDKSIDIPANGELLIPHLSQDYKTGNYIEIVYSGSSTTGTLEVCTWAKPTN